MELSQFFENGLSTKCISIAELQLKSLSSSYYHAQPGENAGLILKHGVGVLPANSEIEIPLIYADYS